jgi:hypothetical protein
MKRFVPILIFMVLTLGMIGCGSAPTTPVKKPRQEIHSDYSKLPAAEPRKDDIKIGMTKDQVKDALSHHPEIYIMSTKERIWKYGEKRTTNPQGYQTELVHELTFKDGRLVNKKEYIFVSPLGW